MLHDLRGAEVVLTGLEKVYGSTVAVDAIDLTVHTGAFVTLLGPSGSGKTTTLNMIAGFVEPTSGSITMDGEPISRLPPHKRNIGMVFQNYALFPHMTAAQNVAFPLRRRRTPKGEIDTRVDEALALVGLHGRGSRYPRELSGGQQQRVALARALVFQPRLLLMDEPLGALDKNLRDQLQLEFKRIHEELGITFVYVTHDQDEALVLSDVIAVFNEGRIEQVGSGATLYERPETLFVAQFLGESNRLRGSVRASEPGVVLTNAGHRIAFQGPVDGNDVVVVVRPERVTIADVSGAPADANKVAGVVSRVLYVGKSERIEVVVADTKWTVRRTPRSGLAVEPGQHVELTWSDRDQVVVPFTDAIPEAAAEGPPEDLAALETSPATA